MSGVVSCILPEGFLTMALSNPALQDLYFLFRRKRTIVGAFTNIFKKVEKTGII